MYKKTLLVAILTGIGTSAYAGKVFSPEQGVICDRKSGFCADSEGISLSLTGIYLGKKRMIVWQKRLDRDSFDPSVFTMSNGLYCDTKRRICKKSKWDDKPDARWSAILFGTSIRR